MTELPQPGALLGPTFTCIIGRQFHNLRFGDRFIGIIGVIGVIGVINKIGVICIIGFIGFIDFIGIIFRQ